MSHFLSDIACLNLFLNKKKFFLGKRNFLPSYKLEFTLYHYDPQTLYKIRQLIGFGKVSSYSFKSHNLTGTLCFYYKYSITDFEGITRLVLLFKDALVLTRSQKNYFNLLIFYNFFLNFKTGLFLGKKKLANLVRNKNVERGLTYAMAAPKASLMPPFRSISPHFSLFKTS